ncbi:MAG: hypothetical protein EU531_00830 [Promethearchaeota archaeon]|nr:MAG: hypothetical protein EU531_00830 [Candidatus Lokiarchaeota archaeon]
MERLYQPDFTCIFGVDYGDAFSYRNIDSLIWPIFSDIEPSNTLKNLLKIKDNEGNPLFYRRNLRIEDLKIEMNCSNIHVGLIQAMNTSKSYGIANSDVIELVKRDPSMFKGILSFNLNQKTTEHHIINEIQKIQDLIPVCGVAIYPSLTKLNLTEEVNQNLMNLMNYCRKNSLFIKVDLSNFKFGDNHSQFASPERIESFIASHLNNYIILSGFSIYNEFENILNRFKKYPNVWLEFDPRSIGGMTPSNLFTKIFGTQGFIQNFWQRISIGSATPTLEISQIVRGFIEATEKLNFTQKNLLLTWAFRNLNRFNKSIFKPIDNGIISTYPKIKEQSDKSYINQIISTNIVQLRSYSITQLLFLTDIIKNIFDRIINKYPELNDGELLLRSYHTTTTLLINEHEVGNYLDLHYYFAELSTQDSSDFMHTVLAEENRPDFNHLDHRIASTYGSKQLVLPIRNRKLKLGSRENLYLLATFGPRILDLLIEIKLYKEN